MDRMPRQRWLTEEQYHRLFPWRGRRLVGVLRGVGHATTLYRTVIR